MNLKRLIPLLLLMSLIQQGIYSPIREIFSGQLVSCPYNRLVIPSVGTGYCLSEIAKIRFSHGKVNSYYSGSLFGYLGFLINIFRDRDMVNCWIIHINRTKACLAWQSKN